MKTTALIITTIFFAAALWWTVTGLIFRFRHPEMTETQLILHTWEALTLQRLDGTP